MNRSEWHDGDAYCLEAMKFLAMNPTPKRRLSVDGFPHHKNVKPAPCS